MSTADDSYEPTSSSAETPPSEVPTASEMEENDDVYKFLVLDSGPIVRLTGLSTLKNRAKHYYTVPAVLQEIRDAKARQHLKQLPFDLVTREASPQGIRTMADFARQTGDYNSLSAVDLQVLGLLHDLETEASGGNLDHVRKTPKRTLGVGRIEALNKEDAACAKKEESCCSSSSNPQESTKDGIAFFQPGAGDTVDTDTRDATETSESAPSTPQASGAAAAVVQPKTWAMMVNPIEGSAEPPAIIKEDEQPKEEVKVADKALNVAFGSMKLSKETNEAAPMTAFVSGQFSDAEEEDDDDDGSSTTNSDKDDESEYEKTSFNKDISDEQDAMGHAQIKETIFHSDFPSLAQAMQVPYEGSDEDDDEDSSLPEEKTPAILAKEHAETKRALALQPATKQSGKRYNSFRKYRDIVKPKGVMVKKKESFEDAYYTSGVETVTPDITTDDDYESSGAAAVTRTTTSSRIMGGMTMSGQASQVDDDGEGWITCKSDITRLKSTGALDVTASSANRKNSGTATTTKEKPGPPLSQRAACATTDFAMQNVILQMNLELLSVDGIKVRRLKSWVTRCGACFTVYADNNDPTVGNLKRLFCARCGSDMMQRVAASVDSKTGRLRLHLSKKYKNNLRGTKYSLPKAGSNNRFQGDLLLREDQLLMGAWNQKVKKRSGGKARSSAQSMFGSDLASNVGCHADLIKRDDIKVGFGRRNPNAAKGRERRGKKKKSSDKACGLRRY